MIQETQYQKDQLNKGMEEDENFEDINDDESSIHRNRYFSIQEQKQQFIDLIKDMFYSKRSLGKNQNMQSYQIIDDNENILKILIQLDQFSKACINHCFITFDFKRQIIESRSYISDYQGKMVRVEEKYLNRLLLRYFTKLNQTLKSGGFFLEKHTQYIMFKINPIQQQNFWQLIFERGQENELKNKQYLQDLISSLTFTHHYAMQFHIYRIYHMINKFKEDDLLLLEKELHNQMKRLQPATQKHLENIAEALAICNKPPTANHNTQYSSYFSVNNKSQNQQQLKILTPIYLPEQKRISDFSTKEMQFESTGFSDLYRTEVQYSLQPHGQDRIKKVMAIKVEKDREQSKSSTSNRVIHEKNILKRLTDCKPGYSPFVAMSFEAAEGDARRNFQNVLFTEYYFHSSLDKFKNKFQVTQSLNTKIYILSQIALGLKYIHSCDVIHNDIKPGNIFISKNYLAKISDFGEAKCPKVEKKGGSGLTFPYASPELMLKQNDITYQSDIFSFGVLMYEYLFDCYPIDYKKSDTDKLIERYKKKIFTLRSKKDFIKKKGPKKLMSYLGQLSLLCLHHDPDQRPHVDWIVICLRESLQYIEKMY